ncbi:thermonuclease family protein [Pontibacter sp. SGAir0037]|uniref:thermonuclease family protein n=1 Tax=Pontibacter sp. SGAir0037 TaxID=2571030 RepID=UPI0010CCED24|nr:thermonuclease family protein [Pontibacter sp. SGAir0037]QCR21280.1 SNase-like nuclease [Pontibacter sp. SGAir0037]
MKKTLFFYFSLLILLSITACRQDNDKAREEFRQRQQTVNGRAAETSANDTNEPANTPAAAETRTPENIAGDKIVGVKDGDTFELLRDGKTSITVRLYGIDTPEKNQAFGQRARQFASDLAFGKMVRLIEHNKDRYGRTVGTIILPDGRNLNEELVREGYAWHYKAYSKDKNLENLEADARRFKRGLWQDPNPTPPWDFRKEKRSGTTDTSAAPATSNKAPIPAGATKRQVYICDSSGSAVYHLDQNCSVLKRCKAEMLTITEASAIREYNRRLDKTCGSK